MKRFLMVIAAVALAALVAVSLMRGTTSVSAATNTAQTQQNGPGDCGPGGPRQDDGTHAGGQVASLSGSTITVTGRDGTSQDILTSASTTFDLDGSASSLSAIAAGQFIHADGATDTAGAFTATAVHASATQPQGRPDDGNRPAPRQDDGTHAGGQVASLSGSTITVTGRDGTSQDILTSASTTFDLDGSASSLSAIAAGQFIHADGATDTAGAFTATAVHASTTQPQGRPDDGNRPAPRQDDGTHAGGQVASLSGSTITVTGRDGTSQDILTSASTTFDLDGSASSLSAIAAGQFIHADGATDTAGAFTATAVHASTTQPQGRPGPGGPPPARP